MTLDIVIPTLNEEKNLVHLLPYLKLNSNSKNTNIIIVDAASSVDNTLQICNNQGITYLQSSSTHRSIQLNEGANHLIGKYIMFLHADVMPPQNYYDVMLKEINAGFKAGCFSYKFRSDKLILKLNSFFTRFKGVFTGGGDQTIFISRKVFEDLEGYCEEHMIMEDFELYQRINKNNIPFTVINSPALVSARKYINNSWLKVNLINLIAFASYKVYQDPLKVKLFYERWLSN